MSEVSKDCPRSVMFPSLFTAKESQLTHSKAGDSRQFFTTFEGSPNIVDSSQSILSNHSLDTLHDVKSTQDFHRSEHQGDQNFFGKFCNSVSSTENVLSSVREKVSSFENKVKDRSIISPKKELYSLENKENFISSLGKQKVLTSGADYSTPPEGSVSNTNDIHRKSSQVTVVNHNCFAEDRVEHSSDIVGNTSSTVNKSLDRLPPLESKASRAASLMHEIITDDRKDDSEIFGTKCTHQSKTMVPNIQQINSSNDAQHRIPSPRSSASPESSICSGHFCASCQKLWNQFRLKGYRKSSSGKPGVDKRNQTSESESVHLHNSPEHSAVYQVYSEAHEPRSKTWQLLAGPPDRNGGLLRKIVGIRLANKGLCLDHTARKNNLKQTVGQSVPETNLVKSVTLKLEAPFYPRRNLGQSVDKPVRQFESLARTAQKFLEGKEDQEQGDKVSRPIDELWTNYVRYLCLTDLNLRATSVQRSAIYHEFGDFLRKPVDLSPAELEFCKRKFSSNYSFKQIESWLSQIKHSDEWMRKMESRSTTPYTLEAILEPDSLETRHLSNDEAAASITLENVSRLITDMSERTLLTPTAFQCSDASTVKGIPRKLAETERKEENPYVTPRCDNRLWSSTRQSFSTPKLFPCTNKAAECRANVARNLFTCDKSESKGGNVSTSEQVVRGGRKLSKGTDSMERTLLTPSTLKCSGQETPANFPKTPHKLSERKERNLSTNTPCDRAGTPVFAESIRSFSKPKIIPRTNKAAEYRAKALKNRMTQ